MSTALPDYSAGAVGKGELVLKVEHDAAEGDAGGRELVFQGVVYGQVDQVGEFFGGVDAAVEAVGTSVLVG